VCETSEEQWNMTISNLMDGTFCTFMARNHTGTLNHEISEEAMKTTVKQE
jgi:hypothetical protein